MTLSILSGYMDATVAPKVVPYEKPKMNSMVSGPFGATCD